MKQYKVALFIGRFQPFHRGHLYSLKKCFELADHVLVGIGSSQESGTESNPWDWETRKKMIETLDLQGLSLKVVAIPDLFNDEKWGAQIVKLLGEAGCEPSQVVAVGNNEWTNRILRERGIAVYESGLYKRNELEGKKIRKMMKRGDGKWKKRVPKAVLPSLRSEEIALWLRKIYRDKPAVIGVSGGVDSAVALTLLVRALGKERVIPLCLPYKNQEMHDAKQIIEWNGLSNKLVEINLAEMVDGITGKLEVGREVVRKGNILARVRMICLFDMAKRVGGMVCGTENKSERELGYYTRFGDAASDVEPIAGFYKTEIWELARDLGLPEVFVTKKPSAELWTGQSDEGEMGFGYLEADRVLRGETGGIEKKVIAQVRERVAKQKFKREVPYQLT
ncbi:MAG: NAD(+) synthase [bacterium]